MKYKNVVLITAFIFLAIGCGKKETLKLKQRDILLVKDQRQISFSNSSVGAWSSFKKEGNFLVSERGSSKLVIFRKSSGNGTLGIKYRLKSGKCEVSFNGIKVMTLFPSAKTRGIRGRVRFLRGINFIEFRTGSSERIRVAKVWTEKGKKETGQFLVKGDRVVKYFSYGKGKIYFEGSGKIFIKKVDFRNGQKRIEKKELTIKEADSEKKSYPYEFKTIGFVDIEVENGKITIPDFRFKKKGEVKEEVNIPELKGKPDVYILVVDGCHASHLGLYGYKRDTSPAIDSFAKESVIFENAYANASFTRSSVASIFTGFYPQRHKVLILKSRLPDNLYIMPEFFRSMGYKTGVITEAGNISMVFGFKRGVTEYHKAFFRWDDPGYRKKNNIKFFRNWIENESPLFTYVHFREPHFPIVPPPPYRDMFGKRISKDGKRVIFRIAKYDKEGHEYTRDEKEEIINDYDSSIRHVTDSVDKLFEMLKKKGMYENSIIVFTADHGEAVYEHGAWGHGSNVYNETTRVPLVVKFPGYMGLKGIRVKRLTQLVDLFPTFMSLFSESRVLDGESLFRSIKNSGIDDRFVFSTSFNTPQSFGIRWRNYYYIIDLKDNSEKLYNLDSDPISDISQQKEDIILLFKTKFLNWLNFYDNLDTSARNIDLKKLPKGERENLKSLGYIN